MSGGAAGEVRPARSRLFVALFVAVIGLVVLVPNAWPLLRHWSVDRSEAVTARWAGSVVTHSARDTVSVPAYAYERRIGPMVQECRVDVPRYRHAPEGKPLRETLTVVPGTTCEDMLILDDPPLERLPLALLGLAIAAAGLALAVLALRRRGA